MQMPICEMFQYLHELLNRNLRIEKHVVLMISQQGLHSAPV